MRSEIFFILFLALERLYCNDICTLHPSGKQQKINVHGTHFRYIDSNTPIKYLFQGNENFAIL